MRYAKLGRIHPAYVHVGQQGFLHKGILLGGGFEGTMLLAAAAQDSLFVKAGVTFSLPRSLLLSPPPPLLLFPLTSAAEHKFARASEPGKAFVMRL